jgi:hypothetical protein
MNDIKSSEIAGIFYCASCVLDCVVYLKVRVLGS